MADEETTAYESLSWKQQAFVDAFVTCGYNATEAARRAEYAHPNTQGPRLLVNVGIAAAISEKLAEKVMARDEVLARLSDIARASIEDVAEVRDSFGKPTLRITPGKAVEEGKGHIIKKVKEGQYGIEVELHDSHAALRDLGKYQGLFGAKGTREDPIIHEIKGVNFD